MKNLPCILTLGLVAVMMTAVASAPGLTENAWGQSFGIVAATVEKGDDARGLTVRSEPSESGQILGYLPIGTAIRACNEFKSGWVKLADPAAGGWVNMSNLKPVGGEAKVIAVDQPDLCLPVRKGPGNSYEKVGCAELGQKLNLSGAWSETNWARLDNGGWVDASKIDTDLMKCEIQTAEEPLQEPLAPLPMASASGEESYTREEAPSTYYEDYSVPYFLGDYGAYGYYPAASSYVAVILVDRHHRHHHHRHHPHPFVRPVSSFDKASASNRSGAFNANSPSLSSASINARRSITKLDTGLAPLTRTRTVVNSSGSYVNTNNVSFMQNSLSASARTGVRGVTGTSGSFRPSMVRTSPAAAGFSSGTARSSGPTGGAFHGGGGGGARRK